MKPGPSITVAICAHNRAAFVDKAIGSVLRQVTAVPFGVLVVDNASCDDTPAVLGRIAAADPRVRVVREDRLGLSHARNRAIVETDARYIAYLDDDAIAGPGWLQSLIDGFGHVRPGPVAVGGPVRPIWGGPRPTWLGDGIRGCLTIVDFGDRAHVIEDLRREFIAGANMAFLRDALSEVGGFDTSLGRIGPRLLSGEEILLLRQLSRRGGRIYYEPRAAVHHFVPPERLDKRWFYRRYYWDGISQAVGDIRLDGPGVAQRLRRMARSTYGFVLQARYRGLLTGDEARRLRARLETLRYVSKMFGYMALR